MKKVMVAIAVLTIATPLFATPEGRTAMVLPPLLGGRPGYHPQALVHFLMGLAQAGESAIDVYAPEEYGEGLRVLVGQLMAAVKLATEVTIRTEPLDETYDKVIWLGGFSWYGLVYPNLPVEGAQGLLALSGDLASRGKLLMAVGSGIIHVILMGVLPPGTEVAVYPCQDLVNLCQEHGLVPLLPTGEVCQKADGRGLPPAGFKLVQAEDKKLLVAAIPCSWYGVEEEKQLEDDYGEAYSAAVRSLIKASLEELSPGWSTEVPVACPEPAAGSNPDGS